MKGAHTPDNMYFQLLELKEEREMALDTYHAQKLRSEGKKSRALAIMAIPNVSEWEKKEAEAELLEVENALKYEKDLYEALMDELAFIQGKITEIEPLRKYKDLPLMQAHEASQREAWKIELIQRAENSLLTTGTISPDHFVTMRLHPDFLSEILPTIKEIQLLSKSEEGLLKLEERIRSSEKING